MVTCSPGALPVAVSGSHGGGYEDGWAVFWVVAPCSLVDVCRRLRAKIAAEAVTASETSVKFYQITRSNILQDSHLRVSSFCACW
jgi:hypothetical protein